jgi:hypothetical protein
MRCRTPVFFCTCLAALAFPGCEALSTTGPDSPHDPRSLTGDYAWVFQRWDQGIARGYPVVELSWSVPARYDREPFRVYARRGSSGSYGLIATVTSCLDGVCRYSDTNVAGGQSYDYFIATLDDRTGDEIGASTAIRVDVPARPAQNPPPAPIAISLDGATFLRWTSTGADRYLIAVEPEGGTTFLIGETDGLSFYDGRAENGSRYRYHLAAVDGHGHVSALGPAAEAFPRPDFHADVVYVIGDSLAASGFRFVASETDDPIVPGNSPAAQWRLEAGNGTLRIQPLGQTGITAGTFTTQLTCGPGSDANCVDVRRVPANAVFSPSAIGVQTGFTYLLRVVADDGRTRYAKLRVQGSSVNASGKRLIVFDWAYQLRPDERSLEISPEITGR